MKDYLDSNIIPIEIDFNTKHMVQRKFSKFN